MHTRFMAMARRSKRRALQGLLINLG